MKNKILVIDDSRSTRAMVTSILKEEGYQVETAESGEQAYQLLESFSPDLITLDVNMPGEDGFSICRRIKNDFSNEIAQIPILFLTGNDKVSDREKGFELGANNFITKEDVQLKLLYLVKQILRGDQRYKGLKVLIVDDNKAVRHMLASSVKEMGLNSRICSDGDEALEAIKQNPDQFDLIITDIVMERMHGNELVDAVRNKLNIHDIPIIVLTAANDKDKLINMFKLGVDDYIHKPFLKEEFVARLTNKLENRLLQIENQTYYKKLEKLNQLKSDYVSVCAHDFRSPIGGIIGLSELLLEDRQSKNSCEKIVGMIKNASEDLLTLVDDILDSEKLEKLERREDYSPIHVARIVGDSTPYYAKSAKQKEILLDTEIQLSGQETILGCELSLKRILNNLVSNAIKFTPKEGRIAIKVELEENKILITVQDSGIGIPEDKLGSLFEKYTGFSRRGTQGEVSTGLGLYITKQLIAAQNGTVDVLSQENEGTRFMVKFPLNRRKT